MFTKTFNNNVIEQFNKRSLFNSHLNGTLNDNKSYQKWITRMPIIMAYSNVRFENQSFQDYLQYGVMGTKNIQQYTSNKEQNFTDFYQINTELGVNPKPVIKSFQISGRGSHGTLRQATLTIQCFNYQQFLNVKRYFAVPTTSLFIQYGHIIDQGNFKKSIFGPIKSTNDITGTYLDKNALQKQSERNIDIQCIKASVYNLEINQQGDMFTIDVQLLTTNVSQITNIINANTMMSDLIETENPDVGQTFTYQDQTYILTDKVVNMSEKKAKSKIGDDVNDVQTKIKNGYYLYQNEKGQNYILKYTNHKKNYVYGQTGYTKYIMDFWNPFADAERFYTKSSYYGYTVKRFSKIKQSNFIKNYLNKRFEKTKVVKQIEMSWQKYLQAVSIMNVSKNDEKSKSKLMTDHKYKYVSIHWIMEHLIEPMWRSINPSTQFKWFVIPYKVDNNHLPMFVSNNNGVKIIYESRGSKYKFNQIPNYSIKFNCGSGQGIEEFKKLNFYNKQLIWVDKYQEYLYDFINQNYPNSNNEYYDYGKILINLDNIINFISSNKNTTIDQIISYIIKEISSATSNKLNLVYVYNHKKERYQITQKQFFPINLDNSYQVKNYGPQSMVRDVTYNVTMPDGFKMSLYQAYSDIGVRNILTQMFGESKGFRDISKNNFDIKIEEDQTSQSGQQFENKLNKAKSIKWYPNHNPQQELFWDYTQKLNFSDFWNNYQYNQSIKFIKNNYNNKPTSSLFKLSVQFTVDFIGGIQWGQIFKFYFNPLGWECKFFVSDVKQVVNQDISQTTITGVMIG